MQTDIIYIIIIAVLAIGQIASAINSIWGVSSKVKNKQIELVRNEMNPALENLKIWIKEEINTQITHSQKLTQKDLEALSDKLNYMAIDDATFREQQLNTHVTLKSALVETFKQDIRDVYYKLRETGEISDQDKAYIDKIYPYYVALGGNSDIHAKMQEINEVYSRHTHEKYEETRKKKKTAKTKQSVESSDSNDINQSE